MIDSADERAAWLRLTLTPGVGPAAARDALRAFGLPQNVLAATPGQLQRVLCAPLAMALSAPPDAAVLAAIAAAESWLRQSLQHRLLTWADADYPQALLSLTDPPPLLYVAGRVALLNRPAVAIVGSRSASKQGAETAAAFAQHLCDSGYTVVSGLALGVDGAAHRGALNAVGAAAHASGLVIDAAIRAAEAGRSDAAVDGHDRSDTAKFGAALLASTVAVIGTGMDIIYPRRHVDLAGSLCGMGAMISELPPGTAASRHQFPRRNRLIAALSRGVLVVEAAVHSGSLITARLGAELGREVFAIPGSIHSPLSRGCHRLIRDGAKLVETANDVIEELQQPAWRLPHKAQGVLVRGAPEQHDRPKAKAADSTGGSMDYTNTGADTGDGDGEGDGANATANANAGNCEDRDTYCIGPGSNPAPDRRQLSLLQALGTDPATLDTLIERTGRGAGDLMAELLKLELASQVERLPGNCFQRLFVQK